MTLISSLPFVVLIFNLSTPTGAYNNKAQVQYVNSYNSYVKSNNDVYLTQFNVQLDLDLYFDDESSYRLDFKSVSVSWYVGEDNDSFTYNINMDYGFNYDTITNFVPKFTFLVDDEDDMISINVFNNNTQLYHYEYDLDLSITERSYISAEYRMTSFYTYLDEYLSMNAQLTADYNNGYQNGYNNGYYIGFDNGKGEGYAEGFSKGTEVDNTAITIFNGILNIALVPINFFLAIFNFEILGINISSLVSALLSICLVIIVVRFVTGKKQGGD